MESSGNEMMAWDRSPQRAEDRFMQKIVKCENGCWLWKAASNGYGRFSIHGRTEYAHIASWFIHTGKWPEKFICHTCDNRLCVNPSHLFEGTAKDNTQDALAKGRPMGRPTRHSSARISEVKTLLALGRSQREVSRQTRVPPATVSEISRGKRGYTR